jgi:hypothetical protein
MRERLILTARSHASPSVRHGGEQMTDILLVALMVGFFALAALFVRWLDRV